MSAKQASTNNLIRVERIKEALREWDLDALCCVLPENVLLLSGYWPVVGTSLALATREGRLAVLAPEDELELAHEARADEVFTVEPGIYLENFGGLRQYDMVVVTAGGAEVLTPFQSGPAELILTAAGSVSSGQPPEGKTR